VLSCVAKVVASVEEDTTVDGEEEAPGTRTDLKVAPPEQQCDKDSTERVLG